MRTTTEDQESPVGRYASTRAGNGDTAGGGSSGGRRTILKPASISPTRAHGSPRSGIRRDRKDGRCCPGRRARIVPAHMGKMQYATRCISRTHRGASTLVARPLGSAVDAGAAYPGPEDETPPSKHGHTFQIVRRAHHSLTNGTQPTTPTTHDKSGQIIHRGESRPDRCCLVGPRGARCLRIGRSGRQFLIRNCSAMYPFSTIVRLVAHFRNGRWDECTRTRTSCGRQCGRSGTQCDRENPGGF
jgi:hypothetical protein